MAKINMDEIDEQFVVSSVMKGRSATMEITPPPLAPLPATAPAHAEELQQPPKEEGRRKRSKADYEALFIKESNVTARLGKTVYIRKEFHDRILKITQVIGDNEVSVFSYIDNVLAHHFDSFHEDITLIYNRKNSSIF